MTREEIIAKYDELMNAECIDDYEEIERDLLREAINYLKKHSSVGVQNATSGKIAQ